MACGACGSVRPQPRVSGRVPRPEDSRQEATVLAVLLPDSGAVAWARVAHVLAQHGYRVAEREARGLRLVTAPTLTGNGQCAVTLHVTVMGHVALLSGQVFCERHAYRPKPMYYSHYGNTVFGHDDAAWGWSQLARIAGALPAEKVHYFHLP